jgi:hypothetical protein
MASVALNSFGVFGDEVYSSTDLNRRSGEVLNHAREHPVTISRNNELFALLRRDHAAKLVRSVNTMHQVFELLSEAHRAISGEPTSIPWLKIYEKDDLQKLCSEVLNTARTASDGLCDWKEVEAIIHEWKESALVASSGVLDAAMYAEPPDETPLPEPEQLSKTAEDAPEPACQPTT